MTAQPTFGELVVLGRRHLAAAAGENPTVSPGRQTQQLASSLTRLLLPLRRCTKDLTRTAGQDAGAPDADLPEWERAALDADYALGSALAVLQQIPGSRTGTASFRNAANVVVAAAALTAGRDLLQGHFITTPSGERRQDSGWAGAINSAFVRTALLTEIGELAGLAAAVTGRARPAQLTGAHLTEPEALLRSAGTWLARCHAASSSLPQPDQQQARLAQELLYAIPVNVMPQRARTPEDPSVSDLCQGVTRTASRTMHASWTASTLNPHSPAMSIASWRATAGAAMVTSHHCHILCSSLAGHENLPRRALKELEEGAARADQARRTWLRLARQLQDVTTDTRTHLSPAAAETTDLAVWTGRLAYANPSWTLSSGPGRPPRTAQDMAPRPSDIPAVVDAIHHATEALAAAASSVVRQAHSADRAHRILVPTRSQPEHDNIPRPYTVAPASHARLLLETGYTTETAALDTADTLGRAADATGAPSRTLATARAASRHPPDHQARTPAPARAPRQDRPEPGPCETALRQQGITAPRLLWHASALDQTARQRITETTARQATLRAARPAPPTRPAKDLEAG